jgi:hypothetical protein
MSENKREKRLEHIRLHLMSDQIPGLIDAANNELARSTPQLRSGYTTDLISTPAVIFSKLALRAGFHIDTKSPFVPAEWLPVAPLPRYEQYFDIRE